MAPYRSTSTDSPVGRLAVTRELSCEIDTFGVGIVGETGMAEGFLGRSMLWLLMCIDNGGEMEAKIDRLTELHLKMVVIVGMERSNDPTKTSQCE